MFTCVELHAQVLAHMGACACEDLKQMLGIFLDYFPPYTLKQPFSENAACHSGGVTS